jgi:hypothetical protein
MARRFDAALEERGYRIAKTMSAPRAAAIAGASGYT